jgi:D-beta-D-heptose 7-phosphate kinase/D-beta-D-heptose 1-phosphate adenosyltransferase
MIPPTLTPALLERVLGHATGLRVLVVGDIMLDRYLSGEVSRISPEAPVPVLHATAHRRALGGAANVAAGVRALGASCRLVGVVGDDAAGTHVRRLVERRDIPSDGLVVDPSRPTTAKLRVLARHQQVLRIDRESTHAVDQGVSAAILERAGAHLADVDVLVLQDYDKGSLLPDTAAPLLAQARTRDIVSIVDPKLRNFFMYPGCDVFKPNGSEVAAATGQESPPETPEELLAVARRVGCRHLLMTLGERGMCLLAEESGVVERIPSRAREVYDVSGAGDTVTAALAVAFAAGATPSEAALLANFAAGLSVARLGARPIERREMRAGLETTRE